MSRLIEPLRGRVAAYTPQRPVSSTAIQARAAELGLSCSLDEHGVLLDGARFYTLEGAVQALDMAGHRKGLADMAAQSKVDYTQFVESLTGPAQS